MREYTPDRWMLIKITSKEEGAHYRFLAGWYGGFASGNSWKLSSGLLEDKITVNEHGSFVCPQSSGSCYIVHPSSIGMSSLMMGIAKSFIDEAVESNGELQFEVIDQAVALEFLNGKKQKAA